MARLERLFPFVSIFSLLCLLIGYDFFYTNSEKIIFSTLCFLFFLLELFFVLKQQKSLIYILAYSLGIFAYFLFHIRNYLSFYFINFNSEYSDIFLKGQDILLVFLVLFVIGYILFILLLKLSSHSILYKNSLQIKKHTLIKNSVLNVISIIILLISINYVAAVKNKNFDLSRSNYTFSPLGKKIISSIKNKIYITAFYPHILENLSEESQLSVHKVRLDLEILFDELSILNHNIKIEWANADIDKQKTGPFGQVENGTIFFRSKNKNFDKIVNQEKVFIQSQEDLKSAEKKILNALLNVSQIKQKIYFTQANGERFSPIYQRMKNLQIQQFKTSLNYQLEPLEHFSQHNLSIPSDAAGILIIGPTKKFSINQQQEISLYLKKGGKLFICIEPTSKVNFAWLLENWNIQFHNKKLIEPNSTQPNFLFTQNLQQEIMLNQFQGLFFPYSGYLERLEPKDKLVQVFVESSFKTFLDRNNNLSLDKDEVQKKFLLAAWLKSSQDKKAQILIFSSTAWLSDEYINLYSNRELAFQSINWLMREKNLEHIPNKEIDNHLLRLTQTQKRAIWLLTMFFYPICILLICVGIKKIL